MNLDYKSIKDLYENVDDVWPQNDLWHLYSKAQIEKYLNNMAWESDDYVLNAGSGGNDYGINVLMHHRDIAKNLVEKFEDFSVGSIETLPFPEQTFSKIICVGSVINYCDAVNVITEFTRVIKKGGVLALEFESSCGFEHRKKDYYNNAATVVKLKYFDEYWTQWIYSPAYIKSILKSNGFKISDDYRFHILSALSYSKKESENLAAKYVKWDKLFRHTLLARHANNVILRCVKL